MNRIVVAAAALVLSVSAASADILQSGKASWYKMGHTTANGEAYDPDGLTAAHRTLPFGTKVKVRDRKSGAEVVVRINDRGPFVGDRVIDLSRGAARSLGMINKGVTSVDIIALN